MRIKRRRVAFAVILLAIGGFTSWAVSPYFLRSTGEEAAPQGFLKVVASGEWSGRGDGIHHASGSAYILSEDDGRFLLRVENFTVTNGPDIHFFLSPEQDVVDRAADLGRLEATQGNFNVEIPRGTTIADKRFVLVYCVPFRILFATAELG